MKATNLREARELIVEMKKDHKDVYVPLRNVEFNEELSVAIEGQPYAMNDHAFAQVAGKLGIPGQYLRRCQPELALHNIHAWQERASKRPMMWRLNEKTRTVRALVSESFTDVPHEAILDAAIRDGRLANFEVETFELTDTQMVLRLIQPGVLDENAGLRHALVLRNSDVGARTFDISAMGLVIVCSNGMIANSLGSVIKRRHIGEIDVDVVLARGISLALESPFPMALASLHAFKVQVLPGFEDEQFFLNQLVGAGLTSKFAKEVILHLAMQHKMRSGWWITQSITELSQQQSPDRRQEYDQIAGNLAVSLLSAHAPTAARRLFEATQRQLLSE